MKFTKFYYFKRYKFVLDKLVDNIKSISLRNNPKAYLESAANFAGIQHWFMKILFIFNLAGNKMCNGMLCILKKSAIFYDFY